eukprot:COSAG06_NODE_8709_length_2091_cov_2.224900_3_plen_148_part_00
MRVMRAGSVLAEPEPVELVTTLEPLVVTEPVASVTTLGPAPVAQQPPPGSETQLRGSMLAIAPPTTAPAASLSVSPTLELQPCVTNLVSVALSQGIDVDGLVQLVRSGYASATSPPPVPAATLLELADSPANSRKRAREDDNGARTV